MMTDEKETERDKERQREKRREIGEILINN